LTFAAPLVRLSVSQYERILAHCYHGLPDEACGLFAGPVSGGDEPTGVITEVYPARNAAASARVYTVDSGDQLRAMRDAEAHGVEIVGCWHSHTNTDPYPSPTDIDQAKWYPTWIYVIVSLRDDAPMLRAYRIRDGVVAECSVTLERG
jgi:proteasome lid subunit RPN8/RPN11